MGDYGHIGEAMGKLLMLLSIVCTISVPLALWKLFDIVWWFCSHISWR